MSSITNVNNNSSVVNVGRTTPVSPGPQSAEKSIPVVMASDQTAIPVVEQNKVQSEVALSLLGIPRAEVALGIFADVNTYDVNPSEWSMSPEYHISGHGVKHLPTEAGALVEAPRNKVAVLTSKRFFRYQPGRVSAATFGVRSSVGVKDFAQNPVIRKYGIYDNYDGYYWESRNNGKEDNFGVVRRTQSIAYSPVSLYGISTTTPLRGDNQDGTNKVPLTQTDDYRTVGKGADEKDEVLDAFPTDVKVLTDNKWTIIDNAMDHVSGAYVQAANASGLALDYSSSTWTSHSVANSYYEDQSNAIEASGGAAITAAQVKAKCRRDLGYWLDNFILDLKHGGKAHTAINTTNFAVSGGTDFDFDTGNGNKPVGIFPDVSRFEKPIHLALELILGAGTAGNAKFYDGSGETASVSNGDVTPATPSGTALGLTTAGATHLKLLTDITTNSFGGASATAFTPFNIKLA